jgi:hypothetical protein
MILRSSRHDRVEFIEYLDFQPLKQRNAETRQYAVPA